MTERTITKVLIAQEDLALGQGALLQKRQGITRQVKAIDLPWVVTAITEIKDLDTTKYTHCTLVKDAISLLYYFDSESELTPDDKGIIKPTVGTGRWLVTSSAPTEISTFAKLQTTTALFDYQVFTLLGHTVAGAGGGQFYYDPTDTSSADDNGTIAVNGSGQRLKRVINTYVKVDDFGAVGNNTADSTNAFDTMAQTVGYILVGQGEYLLSTLTVDVPIFFEPGAAIVVASGQSITFRNRISASSKQQIFKGDGNIYLLNDNALGIGEDSKHVYAAWWGIFPVGQVDAPQTVLINKALVAFTAQTREGIFELDCGSYQIDGTITIPRGVWFKGSSTRRTIIDLVGDGYNALVAGGSAVKISGLQFEQPTALGNTYFDGTQIYLTYDTPIVEDVVVWNPKNGIHLGPNANLAKIRNVRGIYGAEPIGGYTDTDSMIKIESSSVTVDDIYASNTSFGPGNIVLVTTPSATNINDVVINNVCTTEKSTPVKLFAIDGDISNVTVSNVNYTGGTSINSLVDLETDALLAADIRNISIANMTSNNNAIYFLDIKQNSSGHTESISMSSCSSNGFSIKAAKISQTNGDLIGVSIGSSVCVGNNEDEKVVVSGVTSGINIPNHLLPVLTILDDEVGIFTPHVNGGYLLVKDMGSNGTFPQVQRSGAILFDVGASDAIIEAFSGANFDILSAGTIPTGTTGVDGNISVSVADNGNIYIENRSGGTSKIYLAMM